MGQHFEKKTMSISKKCLNFSGLSLLFLGGSVPELRTDRGLVWYQDRGTLLCQGGEGQPVRHDFSAPGTVINNFHHCFSVENLKVSMRKRGVKTDMWAGLQHPL